jgi:hypothetical protein
MKEGLKTAEKTANRNHLHRIYWILVKEFPYQFWRKYCGRENLFTFPAGEIGDFPASDTKRKIEECIQQLKPTCMVKILFQSVSL